MFTIPQISKPENEPVQSYSPGTPQKTSLKAKLKELRSMEIEIPLIIGGKEIKTGNIRTCILPHDHHKVLAHYHLAGKKEVDLAIHTSQEVWKSWTALPWLSRLAIFNKMATLLSGPYRDLLNASTMLNLSKNPLQAEIDSACELIDFFNFNTWFAQEIYQQQPLYSPKGISNKIEYRPLEGFVFAVTPFNFVSIAGNLPSSPALMGNTVVWKPAPNAVYPAYWLMKLFSEAGLPDGVINFIPGPAQSVGQQTLTHDRLAGIHFTGSTTTFQKMWKTVGENIIHYHTYPRIVGETGGKNFCLAHESANIDALVTAIVRGAFEYQGQKCSAISRAYIPSSIWKPFKKKYLEQVFSIRMGDVEDFTNFMNAVIDDRAFKKITSYIEWARHSESAEFLSGGNFDDSVGFFIEPTTIVTTDPLSKLMTEEIFGPFVTFYIYDPKKWDETVEMVDNTSPYGLTGSIFANERKILRETSRKLKYSAGNFYLNDKPTGAVVGQQPFGGGRASGTNDKAGSFFNLLRWISPRTIKENFHPPEQYDYPFMDET